MGEVELSFIAPEIVVENSQIPAHVYRAINDHIQFFGHVDADALEHLRKFKLLYLSLKFNGVQEDAIKLHLIPWL